MDNTAAFTGSLKFISLADLFQILGGNNNTGVLRITSRYSPETGYIYFHNGNPVNADYGSVKGIKAVHDNAINGINGMPPRGGTSLSDEKMKEIVDYMIAESK